MLLVAFGCSFSLYYYRDNKDNKNGNKNNKEKNDEDLNEYYQMRDNKDGNYYSENENMDFKNLRKRSSFDETHKLDK